MATTVAALLISATEADIRFELGHSLVPKQKYASRVPIAQQRKRGEREREKATTMSAIVVNGARNGLTKLALFS